MDASGDLQKMKDDKFVVIEGNLVSSSGVNYSQVEFCPSSGKILKVGKDLTKTPDFKFDNNSTYVFPGMIDVHVHAREDSSGNFVYKEDFSSVSSAAINGGVTVICDMPNNHNPPIDLESYQQKEELVKNSDALITIYLYAAIGKETDPIPNKKIAYKVYMSHSVGGISFDNLDDLKEVLEKYRGCNVSFHCEDPEILEMNSSKKLFYEQRPPEAEIIAIDNAVSLIEVYELIGNICHVSTKAGMEIIEQAKSRGLPVTCEVAPQHLYFSREYIEENGLDHKLFQMNPPIRKREDQLYMLEALKRGIVDFLATDHAPHTTSEKEEGVSGLTGLDSYGPFTALLMSMGVSPETIMKISSKNPAKFLKACFGANDLGEISEGFLANFTVIGTTPVTLIASKLKTKSKQSVWSNLEFPGSVEAVFIAGKRLK